MTENKVNFLINTLQIKKRNSQRKKYKYIYNLKKMKKKIYLLILQIAFQMKKVKNQQVQNKYKIIQKFKIKIYP